MGVLQPRCTFRINTVRSFFQLTWVLGAIRKLGLSFRCMYPKPIHCLHGLRLVAAGEAEQRKAQQNINIFHCSPNVVTGAPKSGACELEF